MKSAKQLQLIRQVMFKYDIKIYFAIMPSYIFDLVLLTYGYGKLLRDLEVIINLGYSDNYKLNSNNFFFSDFNIINL